jgi:hypothetical protein
MSLPHRTRHRFAAAIATACAGLALASAAEAVDLRDWGRKFPASERFVVLSQFSNQAVLDKETQLVWQRTPAANQVSHWHYALAYCIGGAFAGRRGWRLPSVHELSSLVEASAPAGTLALPQGHPFQNVPIGRYWSSTRQANQYTNQTDGAAYTVNFQNGGVIGSSVITVPGYYWCVRGGGPISEY